MCFRGLPLKTNQNAPCCPAHREHPAHSKHTEGREDLGEIDLI